MYVLYGSQTGNAEMIAQDYHEQLKGVGIPSHCAALNTVKKVPLQDKASAVLICCSTTGNGDAPENAENFWRSIKLRSAPKDTFDGIPYAVLGLGDTNYDKFCHMGKAIDKRFDELGGQRFLKLYCADEGTGNMEETIELWKNDCLKGLQKVLLDAKTETKGASNDGDGSSTVFTGMGEDEQIDESKQTAGSIEPEKKSILPAGVLTVSEIASKLGYSNDLIISAPSADQLPRSKSVDWQIEFIADVISDLIVDGSDSINGTVDEEWSVHHPYHAKVRQASWLTSNQPEEVPSTQSIVPTDSKVAWGDSKRVVHLELSLGDSGISYIPGDSVGFNCPNPQKLVDFVVKRLNEGDVGDIKANQLRLDSKIKTEKYGVITLSELLTYKLDLCSIPKKASIATLAASCTDTNEANTMKWMCSKASEGKALWQHYIEEQRMGVAEILHHFPSCKPSLNSLAAILNPASPRYYSIASSPLLNPTSIVVAFSLVRYTCGMIDTGNNTIVSTIDRSGICTSYLEDCLQYWLGASEQKHTSSDVSIPMFHKPATLGFQLPGSVDVPLILIGPGTGVAPFIGFLDHRAQLERSRTGMTNTACTGCWRGGFEIEDAKGENSKLEEYIKSVDPGPIMLFFGCRNEDDYIYRQVLEKRKEEGILTDLEVAFSRMGPEKVYVSHKIQERGSEVNKLLMEDGGYLYICGDGNNMAKDVQKCIVQIIVDHNQDMTVEKAEDFIADLKLRRRFVLDIWS